MAYDERLAARVGELINHRPGVSERKKHAPAPPPGTQPPVQWGSEEHVRVARKR